VLKPVAIIVSAGLLLAACSDEGTDGDTGLLGALGRVRATAETRVSVEYGEPAEVRALLDKDKSRYEILRGFGYGSIAPFSVTVENTLGLDLTGFDGAIFVGKPPKQATVLWGDYDVSAVDGKLRDLDIDSESAFGGTRWHSANDYEINFEGPFTDMAPPQQFNNIVTGNGSFAFAPAAEGVEWVTQPGDKTLADDDALVSLAKCLGDVVTAQLEATGEAVGVREDGTQLICLKGDQGKVSDALKGEMPSTGRPWDDVLPNAKVDQDGALARVTVPPPADGLVGQVMRVMQNGDLEGLR
jgi:hypothetical protein